MITAVDSSVLIDVFRADPEYGDRSRGALRDALAVGGLIACDVVWAEVCTAFNSREQAESALAKIQVQFSAPSAQDAWEAGRMWSEYTANAVKRRRVVADFLIGAHALGNADRLLTRDKGFTRDYFRDLTVVMP